MNGRLSLILSPKEIEELPGMKSNPMELKKHYHEPQFNYSPSSFVPLVTNLQQERLRFFKWGLIPSWSNTSKNTKGLVSIESKAIQEKPVLQSAFKNKRCMVLCSGYYLWKESNAGKIPYYVKHKTAPYFFMGGVWESWEEEQENSLNTFSLITKKPIGLMKFLAQDIPFMIKPSAYQKWMDAVEDNVTDLLAETFVIPENELEYYPVGRKIIKSLENDPRFVQKVSYLIAEQTNLF